MATEKVQMTTYVDAKLAERIVRAAAADGRSVAAWLERAAAREIGGVWTPGRQKDRRSRATGVEEGGS